MSLFLGLDTSNYKTSAAIYRPEDGSSRSCGKLLEVPHGSLGLRQSDALFQHIRQLPEQVRLACGEMGEPVTAVGCSSRPRDREDSYMPCFLAGQCAAECMAAALGCPVYDFSHQQGHLAAAAFSAGRLDLLKEPFLAWHLSGGTTELLLAAPDPDRILRADIIGGTTDISAGQLIDRAGVALGLPFPAGPYVEREALAWAGEEEAFPVKVQNSRFSLSGVQNQYEARIAAGQPAGQVCRFVLNTVAGAVLRATRQAHKAHPLPVLVSGGVSACSLLKNILSQPCFLFAQKGLGGDNALGAAILASMR